MRLVPEEEYAANHGLTVQAVRGYCAEGKLPGAEQEGETWRIPADAPVPDEAGHSPLLLALREQMESKMRGGIYHRTQIDLTYNSNHIEGSRLSKEQTRYIYETNTIGVTDEAVSVDDIIETTNHFRCINFIIEHAEEPLTEEMIKRLHAILKTSTSDADRPWFAVGEYKRLPNEVGGKETAAPEDVPAAMRALLQEYTGKRQVSLEEILDFHYRLEMIHPFQDGNGRVGRLIIFKECLAHHIVPFIITEELKMYYFRGLDRWEEVRGYLLDTCLTAQDRYRTILDYFRITY
ncbi:MAG: Fic family protein [Porphyromonas sp.]|nr:Fic family protein [Porphyromonas sp.]MDD7468807.1 Fic family protein [Bacteroidales bacterium]MDY6102251.1 Fic family protein [Porphyromonas sp.]